MEKARCRRCRLNHQNTQPRRGARQTLLQHHSSRSRNAFRPNQQTTQYWLSQQNLSSSLVHKTGATDDASSDSTWTLTDLARPPLATAVDAELAPRTDSRWLSLTHALLQVPSAFFSVDSRRGGHRTNTSRRVQKKGIGWKKKVPEVRSCRHCLLCSEQCAVLTIRHTIDSWRSSVRYRPEKPVHTAQKNNDRGKRPNASEQRSMGAMRHAYYSHQVANTPGTYHGQSTRERYSCWRIARLLCTTAVDIDRYLRLLVLRANFTRVSGEHRTRKYAS